MEKIRLGKDGRPLKARDEEVAEESKAEGAGIEELTVGTDGEMIEAPGAEQKTQLLTLVHRDKDRIRINVGPMLTGDNTVCQSIQFDRNVPTTVSEEVFELLKDWEADVYGSDRPEKLFRLGLPPRAGFADLPIEEQINVLHDGSQHQGKQLTKILELLEQREGKPLVEATVTRKKR